MRADRFSGHTSDRPNGLRPRADTYSLRYTAPRHFTGRGTGFRKGNSDRSGRGEADSSLLAAFRSATDRRLGGTNRHCRTRSILKRARLYISSPVPELAGHADIDITAHRADRLILIEIERALAARPSAAHMLGLVRSISATLQLGQDLLATCRSATRGLRCLTV